jgi:methionyl-tRNA synthetase
MLNTEKGPWPRPASSLLTLPAGYQLAEAALLFTKNTPPEAQVQKLLDTKKVNELAAAVGPGQGGYRSTSMDLRIGTIVPRKRR